MSTVADNTLRTADGVPLKTSLRRAMARRRIRTFLLVVPILAFLMITFVFSRHRHVVQKRRQPNRFIRSSPYNVSYSKLGSGSEELPPEFVYEALVLDIQESFKVRHWAVPDGA